MKRSEIIQKFSYVKKGIPGIREPGDCYVTEDLSIEKQVKNLKEGAGKIFFFEVTSCSDGEINLKLVSESVYVSPTQYV